jgi:hypothetical protein
MAHELSRYNPGELKIVGGQRRIAQKNKNKALGRRMDPSFIVINYCRI